MDSKTVGLKGRVVERGPRGGSSLLMRAIFPHPNPFSDSKLMVLMAAEEFEGQWRKEGGGGIATLDFLVAI